MKVASDGQTISRAASRFVFTDVNDAIASRVPSAAIARAPSPVNALLTAAARTIRHADGIRYKHCIRCALTSPRLPVRLSPCSHSRAEQRRQDRLVGVSAMLVLFRHHRKCLSACLSNREKRTTLSDSSGESRPEVLRRCSVEREMQSFAASFSNGRSRVSCKVFSSEKRRPF